MKPWLYVFGLTRKRVRAMRRAGDAARDRGDWPAAIACYQDYLQSRPRLWAIWVQLGHAHKEAGDLHAAEAAYRLAAEGAPTDPDALLQLGRSLRLLGRVDAARQAFGRSAALQPGGDAAAELARLEASATVAQAAGSVHRDAGDSARDAQEWRSAARHYADHLKAHPTDAEIWVQSGNMLKEVGLFAEAEQAYHRAIALGPASADSFLQLGHVLKLAGARSAAIEAYQESAALDGSGAAASELASMGVAAGPPGARRTQAPPAKPQSPSVEWRALSDAQAARDGRDWARAAGLYRGYLAARPDAARVWAELAFVLRMAGRYHEALEALHGAAALLPNDRALLHDEALLLRQIGKPDEAALAAMRLMLNDGPPAANPAATPP